MLARAGSFGRRGSSARAQNSHHQTAQARDRADSDDDGPPPPDDDEHSVGRSGKPRGGVLGAIKRTASFSRRNRRRGSAAGSGDEDDTGEGGSGAPERSVGSNVNQSH